MAIEIGTLRLKRFEQIIISSFSPIEHLFHDLK